MHPHRRIESGPEDTLHEEGLESFGFIEKKKKKRYSKSRQIFLDDLFIMYRQSIKFGICLKSNGGFNIEATDRTSEVGLIQEIRSTW
jgi:hypothetical protein